MKFLLAILLCISAGCIDAARADGEDAIVAGADEQIAEAIERGAPTDMSRLEGAILGSIDLAAYGQSLAGGTLRAREVTLLPGGAIGVHEHNHRPAFVYVLEGEFLEHRSGEEEPLVRRAGDAYFEGHGLVHWSENVSDKPVRAVAVDILPPVPE